MRVVVFCVLWLALAGCETTPCESACARLASQCDVDDTEACNDGCDDAEEACERCYRCLESIDKCEIRPTEPCAGDCVGCRGS